MRRRAANGIANGGIDRQVEVGAVLIEWVGIADSQFLAALPPAMFAYDNAWIEFFAETRPGSNPAGRGAHGNPISIVDTACRGSFGMQLNLRVESALAQTRQCSMLGLAKQAWFGAGQDQRKGSSQVGARNRANRRLDKIRQGRITAIQEGLGPELDSSRRRREAARVSLFVARGV